MVDGGWWDDADYLQEQIKKRGGHVIAWFLTHAHTDHVGALLNILQSEAEGKTPASPSIIFTMILLPWTGTRTMSWAIWVPRMRFSLHWPDFRKERHAR